MITFYSQEYMHILQPSNIFISTSGQLQIQLGDFGLACPLQKEKHHSVIGTHLYAAPEQLEGKCDRQVIKKGKNINEYKVLHIRIYFAL